MHVSSICSVKTLISSTFFKNTCDVILRRWGIFLAHFRFAISCLIHSKLKSLDDVTHKGYNLGLNGKFEKNPIILLKVPMIFFLLWSDQSLSITCAVFLVILFKGSSSNQTYTFFCKWPSPPPSQLVCLECSCQQLLQL